MRRTDLEVTDLNQLEDILRSCDVVRVAAQDEQGLFIFPLNFGYALEGDQLTLYVHSTPRGRKAAAFRTACPAAFEMDCGHALRTADAACDHSFTYRSIMGSGVIRTLEDREEKRAALNAIARHMTGRTWDMPDQAVDNTAVFALRAEQWSGKRNQPR